MEPSNPTNGKPFIYRIMDAFGVNHQVVPVNHTHSELVGQTISLVINGQEIEIEPSDVPNLIRALSNPDTTPTASSNNLVTSGGVKAALDSKANASDVQAALAAKMSNTALSIEVEYHMTSQQVKYYGGASSIFTSVPENKIAVAMLYFFSNEGHNPLGNTLVQLRWYNSVNNIYKHIEIFINGAVYNLRYKVETEEWREMVQTVASITQYLPTSAE